MAWVQIKPADLEELTGELMRLSGLADVFCRGEPMGFAGCRTSLGRRLAGASGAERRAAECGSIATFRDLALPYLSPIEHQIASQSIVGTLLLLQQHGGPTRLLDWTRSPWVAAYFAAIAEPEETGVVWSFERDRFAQVWPAPWRDVVRTVRELRTVRDWGSVADDTREWFGVVGPSGSTTRMIAQQSVFTIAGPVHADHAELLGRIMPDGTAVRLEISPALKGGLINLLRSMNITASTLFPGIDGVGRACAERIDWRVPMHRYDEEA